MFHNRSKNIRANALIEPPLFPSFSLVDFLFFFSFSLELSDDTDEQQTGDALYTKPETVFAVYKALAPISPNFSIAAAYVIFSPSRVFRPSFDAQICHRFGNVHGVYSI